MSSSSSPFLESAECSSCPGTGVASGDAFPSRSPPKISSSSSSLSLEGTGERIRTVSTMSGCVRTIAVYDSLFVFNPFLNALNPPVVLGGLTGTVILDEPGSELEPILLAEGPSVAGSVFTGTGIGKIARFPMDLKLLLYHCW